MSTLYSKYKKDNIKTGDLLVWRATRVHNLATLLLWLYQKIFKAKYSHVAVVVVLGNRHLVVEATPPVVRLFPISMMDDFYHIPMNVEENPKHLDILFRKLGRPYNIVKYIGNLFGMTADREDYYCSELAGEFYNLIGKLDHYEVGLTPDTLVDRIVERYGVEPKFVKIDRGNLNAV